METTLLAFSSGRHKCESFQAAHFILILDDSICLLIGGGASVLLRSPFQIVFLGVLDSVRGAFFLPPFL